MEYKRKKIVSKAEQMTLRHQTFCYEYIKTGNACESYRIAYDKPIDADRRIMQAAGAQLKNKPHIKEMIAALREEADAKAANDLGLTREWVLERLMNNAETGAKNILNKEGINVPISLQASNQALNLLGKVDTIGLFVDQSKITIETEFADMTDEELESYVAGNAGHTEVN